MAKPSEEVNRVGAFAFIFELCYPNFGLVMRSATRDLECLLTLLPKIGAAE